MTTAALITPGDLARAAATAAAGAAFSVERHPTLTRGTGLVVSVAVGAWVTLAASGLVPRTDETPVSEAERPGTSPARAAALGLGAFGIMAGTSELGLRGQRGLERWAARTTGHPRLVVGLLSGAVSLAIDVSQRADDR